MDVMAPCEAEKNKTLCLRDTTNARNIKLYAFDQDQVMTLCASKSNFKWWYDVGLLLLKDHLLLKTIQLHCMEIFGHNGGKKWSIFSWSIGIGHAPFKSNTIYVQSQVYNTVRWPHHFEIQRNNKWCLDIFSRADGVHNVMFPTVTLSCNRMDAKLVTVIACDLSPSIEKINHSSSCLH